jgi:hypothetical protein
MATLSDNPEGVELEDFVAAHFLARGVFVETGVTERDPKDILELDVVWTDYRQADAVRNPVEVKSREWHLGELFKFFGWTRYLGLQPGIFVCRQLPTRISIDSIRRLADRMGIRVAHIGDLQTVDEHFHGLELPTPANPTLPRLWRYSFWAQRRLLRALGIAIEKDVCPISGRAAKDYAKLINDAVFFEPDVRSRVASLLDAHLRHRRWGRTAANETAGRGAIFEDPPACPDFGAALYRGLHFPVQACLYLAHRARLAILKAAVDYVLAGERQDLPQQILQVFDTTYDINDFAPYRAFVNSVEQLSNAPNFRLYPVFWQVFLWGWGGFLLKDRTEEESAALSAQTGIPTHEIQTALGAFDLLFPMEGGWFAEPPGESRRLLKLMPAAMRGVGAFSRLSRYERDEYDDLGYTDGTAHRLASDHNCGVRLLDASDDELGR